MISTQPQRRRCAAVFVLLIFSLVQGAATRRSMFPGLDVDLKSEDDTVSSFVDSLVTLDKKRLELAGRPVVSSDQYELVKGDAEQLKRRLPQVRSAIESSITKLKAANLWDSLDDTTLKGITDSRVRTLLQQNGGARRVLDSLSGIGRAEEEELLAPNEKLRLKLKAQLYQPSQTPLQFSAVRIVPAAYDATPFLKKSLRCKLATARVTLAGIVGGTRLNNAINRAKDACSVDLDATADPFQ